MGSRRKNIKFDDTSKSFQVQCSITDCSVRSTAVRDISLTKNDYVCEFCDSKLLQQLCSSQSPVTTKSTQTEYIIYSSNSDCQVNH
ncbi:hypothetical protein GJ496_004730 [Pomphorhynchus laevis]|nr:hypothetical protein GJ496_004730 [Pomphorhynchus laevis]